MNFKTNKEKGNTSLAIAIAFYTSNGYTVSIPLNDTQDYDLIVEKNYKIKMVQVKATSCKSSKSNNYQVALKSCGGTKGTTYKTVIDTKIDEVFILTRDLSIYIIPRKKFLIEAPYHYAINTVNTRLGKFFISNIALRIQKIF